MQPDPPTAADRAGAPPPPPAVHLYAPWWRVVAAVLFAVSRANLPAMLLAVLLPRSRPITPVPFFRTVVLFSVLPGLGAWLVARAMRATVTTRDGQLVVSRLGLRLEIPATAVARIAVWRLPLPGPGFSLVTSSGRRLRYGLQAPDPVPLLLALADRGGIAAAGAAVDHPTMIYTHAKAAGGRWRWSHLAAKFPLFALAPTAVLFNAHQHIAYGGLLGEYYLYGLGAYLGTFALYWATVTTYCVLYASVWRGLAEGVALLAAHVAPSRAARVRRAAEIACRVLYYGGVPVLLALRFAPW